MSLLRARTLSVTIIVLMLVLFAATSVRAQTVGWVDTGGDCLNLRSEPGLFNSENIDCLPHGAEVTILDGEEELDGFTWIEVEYEGQVGWVAGFYITTNPDDVQVIEEPSDLPPDELPTPPEGGLTVGVANGGDPTSLAAAQPFDVVAVWHLDIDSQDWLNYIPGAPAHVNTLSALDDGDVVMIRRDGTLTQTGPLPDASLTVAGTPNVLPVPPIGGLTQGVAGSTDPRFIVQAQDFTTESVAYFHIDSQEWLVYIPGAPDVVNTLRQGQLRTDSVVTLRRGPDAPRPPSSADSTYFETSITYYYCVPGDNPASIGDGGGYCGTMSNGERVHEGAAACSPGLLGQHFTIEGDPTARVYECTDSGGSVLQDHRDIWFMDSDEGYEWWVGIGSRAYITILPDE